MPGRSRVTTVDRTFPGTVAIGRPFAAIWYDATPISSVAADQSSRSHVVPTLPARTDTSVPAVGALVSGAPVVVTVAEGPAVALPVASNAATRSRYRWAGANEATR